MTENDISRLFKMPTLFKDESKLFPEYVPSHLPHREEQLNLLASYLKGLVNYNDFPFYRIICHGPVGTGKTAVVRLFGKILADEANRRGINLQYVHVNCQIERTKFMVVRKTIESLIPSIPKRGFSPQQLLGWLIEYLEDENIRHLLALDEADYLIRTEADTLYDLTRLPEISKGKSRISFILILRDISLIYRLDESILSTLQKNAIKFDPYKSNELFTILKERAEEALQPDVINDKIIEEIVRRIGYDKGGNGDARFALEVLWRSVKIAEMKMLDKVSLEHVKMAFSEMYPGFNQEIVQNLDKHEKIILKAIARAFKNYASSSIPIMKIKENYNIVCEEFGEVPRRYTQFWTYIKNLKDKGLINVEVKSVGRGRRSFISLDIPSEIIEKNVEI